MWGWLMKKHLKKAFFINWTEGNETFYILPKKWPEKLFIFFCLNKTANKLVFFQIAIGINGRVLVVGGGRGVGGCTCDLCDGRSGAAPCWSLLVPAGSLVDPPQDTTEPISRICGISVKMYLRTGSKPWENGRRPQQECSIPELLTPSRGLEPMDNPHHSRFFP